ncbi:hypothetical protein DdX_08398 [Ditylenchus destructor]|uniref:Uncharacterized protein n=1 Tax=Ditylenchus destructor TaxID=166010 RepID=A0AAD4R6U2_9BILA|nr:hypothetical protein DdX_08398 [Ditylenchus destructor]
MKRSNIATLVICLCLIFWCRTTLSAPDKDIQVSSDNAHRRGLEKLSDDEINAKYVQNPSLDPDSTTKKGEGNIEI